MIDLDAKLGQRVGNADLAPEFEGPLHETLEGRRAQVEPAREPPDLVLDRGAIELDHVGHDDGVGQAVVRVENGAHRMGQRMDRAQALLECRRAHLRRRQHVAAGLDVATVLDRTTEVLLHQPHAFDGDALGIGVITRRAIGLETVDEGVHAGASRQPRWQADRQLGVGDHELRHHLRMEDHLLGVGLGIADDRSPAGLGAGAGRGRHGNRWMDAGRIGPRVPVADILEIPQRPSLARHEGDGFAGIDARAAAPRDDAVMLAGAQHAHPRLHIGRHRIGLHVAEHRDLDAGLSQRKRRVGDHRQPRQARIGDQQRPLEANRLAGIGQLADAAGAETDGGREAPVAEERRRGRHQMISMYRSSSQSVMALRNSRSSHSRVAE